jgi:hypothetical protein
MALPKWAAGATSAIAVVALATQSPAAPRAFFWGALNVSAPPTQLANDARIFVSVTNTTMRAQVVGGPMWRLTKLVITDADGKPVLPQTPDASGNTPTGAYTDISLPTNGLYKGDAYSEKPGAGDRLALWGYVLPVGTYRIYAVPTKELWRDPTFGKQLVTSDVISITLH